MTGPVTKAEGVIWLIIGVFWVIAQIAGAAAKKNQPPRPSAGEEEPGNPPGDPFAELMRRMAGSEAVEEFRAEPPKTVFIPQTPWKAGEIESLPDMKPLRRTVPEPEPAAGPLKDTNIDLRPKMSAFRSSVPVIKLPAMNLSFQGSKAPVRKVPDIGTVLNPADRKSLRQAMLSHIVFSPPKALEQTVK